MFLKHLSIELYHQGHVHTWSNNPIHTWTSKMATIKVWCYWEHIVEHIGNLKNLLGNLMETLGNLIIKNKQQNKNPSASNPKEEN